MRYLSETKAALQIAKAAHTGQLRAYGQDLGQPYFDTHVLRVVARVPDFAKPAAALHDVVEDTEETIDSLRETEYFSPATLDAVRVLTREDDGSSYEAYIFRLSHLEGTPGRIARLVKLSDLMDNMSTGAMLSARYTRALSVIAEAALADNVENCKLDKLCPW